MQPGPIYGRIQSIARVILVAPVLTSCAQLAGVDEYTETTRMKSGEPTLEPYLTGAGCAECLQRACRDALSECESDSECTRWIEDARSDAGPVGAFERDRRRLDWHVLGGRYAPDQPDPLDKLQSCSERFCLDDCRLGQDFSCVGEFDWQIPFPRNLRLRVEGYPVGDGEADPWSVQVCDPRTNCQPALASGTTGEEGFLNLDFSAYEDGTPFNGYFAFSGGSEYRRWAGFSSRPAGDRVISFWVPVKAQPIQMAYDKFGASYRADLAYLMVWPYDCNGMAAKHVYVDVKVEGINGLEYCPDGTAVNEVPFCKVTYENDKKEPDSSIADFSTAAGVAYVTFVPSAAVRVLIRRSSDESVVAAVPVSISPGRYHIVRAYPATRQELRTLSRLD